MSVPFDAKIAQRILDEQSYISVCGYSVPPTGAVLTHLNTTDEDGDVVPGPVVVLGPSTAEEFWEQNKRFGLTGSLPGGANSFFRVGAE